MKISNLILWVLWGLSLLVFPVGVRLLMRNLDMNVLVTAIVIVLLALSVFGLFIYDVAKNENLDKKKKTMWILLLIFAAYTVAVPIYLIFERKTH